MTFDKKVYDALKEVPVGMVTTYKALSERIGTNAYRAVGQALKRNPDAPSVPCHRVVRSDGSLGGYAGMTKGKEIRKKISLLESEGLKIDNGKIKNFEEVLWK